MKILLSWILLGDTVRDTIKMTHEMYLNNKVLNNFTAMTKIEFQFSNIPDYFLLVYYFG